MKLLSKITDGRSFWVEDYNQEQKDFFLNLGFKETKFGDKYVLDFEGTKSGLEFWSIQEFILIRDAVNKRFNFKKLPIKYLGMYELI